MPGCPGNVGLAGEPASEGNKNRSSRAHPSSSVPSRSPALRRALQGPSQASCPAGVACQDQSLPRLRKTRAGALDPFSTLQVQASHPPRATAHTKLHNVCGMKRSPCLHSLSPCHQVSSPVPPALWWEFWVTLPTLNKCQRVTILHTPLRYCLWKTCHLVPSPLHSAFER